jgi:hypothetical protein
MSSQTTPIHLRLLLLGVEGGGKTTLTAQLKTMGASCVGSDGITVLPISSWRIREGGSLIIAPTTGQEVDVVAVPPPAHQRRRRSEPEAKDKEDKGEEREKEADTLPGAVPETSSESADRSTGLPSLIPKPGRSGESGKDDYNRLRHVQVKESGGRMVSVWPKFIERFQKEPGPKAFMYVLDLSNPSSLPTAACEFVDLMQREQDLASWEVCLLLNKVSSPAALPVEVVFSLLGILPPDVPDLAWTENPATRANPCWRLAPNIVAIAADTWSGEGLFHVSEWLSYVTYKV